ncbi:hypothetical protein BGX27_004764 [Mortierella sp. AM989]|nr:hypothetical protein BGX27_004764 [Mortierella sp. AM989]
MSSNKSLEGNSSSSAKANALRAIDALLSDATCTAKTPTRRMQPMPPNRRDTLARSPYVPASHPDSNRRKGSYYDDDIDSTDDKLNDESESDDASLNAFSSSKKFAALLQSHVQKQQLLHRQRLQKRHEKQQRLRDYTEYQESLAQKQQRKQEDELEDDSDQDQSGGYERGFGETDSEPHDTRVHSSELPNPFLEPSRDLSSPFVARQRGPLRTKSQNSATLTSLTPTTLAMPATNDTPVANVAATTTTTTGGSAIGITPKRQYKKTILRQQAALLAAQIKDENEIRDMEATKRVFARTSVIEHLRSLRSRLAYAHYKVGQGLEEQPLHIVSELFEESVGESGDSDDNRRAGVSCYSGTTLSNPAETSISQLPVKGRSNMSKPGKSPAPATTHISRSKLGDEEQNFIPEEPTNYQSRTDEILLSTMCETPTKNTHDRQSNVYSDEDSESDYTIDNDLEIITPPQQRPLSHTDKPKMARRVDMTVMSLTHEELLWQQQLQLEELQQKQLEQLRELQRMQREQQIALQKEHTRLPQRLNSVLDGEATDTPLSCGEAGFTTDTKVDKENIELSTSETRSEKGYRRIDISAPYQQSPPKQPSLSPVRDKQRNGKASSKSKPASSPIFNSSTMTSSSPSRVSHTDTAKSANQKPRSSSTSLTEFGERRPQAQRRPLEQLHLLTENTESNILQSDVSSPLSQQRQQQQEYRQRQQQKLQQNRQKEQELLQRHRLLEQEQQKQQKRKQLLLQLQQHQLHEQPQRRLQGTLLPQAIPTSSTPSRPKSSLVSTTAQSTPKKKKPLNPVQKAPSTENILASVRSTPTSMRSAMIATSPALSVVKNVLLGNKRGHATFDDKENSISAQPSPLHKESFITQSNLGLARNQAPTPSKAYKRQRPAPYGAPGSTLSIPETSTTLPTTTPTVDPVSVGSAAILNPSISPSSPTNHAHSASETVPEALAISSPTLVPLAQIDVSEDLQSSKEFQNYFEKWMSDSGGGDIEYVSLDLDSQLEPQPSTPLFVSACQPNDAQISAQDCTDEYAQDGGDSEQEDETELDESEIDRLLYSEVGDDYGSYGEQGCVSTPGSELGHNELASDPGTADIYDWFSDAAQDLQLYGTNEQHLSILSMDPTLSSSPVELAETLELGLEYDSTGDLLWVQQEQQLQQLQHQHQYPPGGESHDLNSSRSGTPQLDSTASTLLSSSFSDILQHSTAGNHSNQYIPMGLDGGLISSNTEDANADKDEVRSLQKDSFVARNDSNFEYIFGV